MTKEGVNNGVSQARNPLNSLFAVNMTEIQNNITDLRKIARSRGGDCLGASSVKSSRSKLTWICAEGHKWKARADRVRRGTWCRKCNTNKQKNTIDDMRHVAARREGECLSQLYINANTKLTWKCKNGHTFKATPGHVKQGRWCRICGVQRAAKDKSLSLAEIQQIAKTRDGRCLSNVYDPKEKLKWQCDKGHIWEAVVHSVKSGTWCPICAHARSGRKPLTIAQMRDIAATHKGLCLASRYQNANTKLKWQCMNGHRWWALPSLVKKGHWCAECAGVKKLDLKDVQKVARTRGGQCLSQQYNNSNEKLKWRCMEGHMWFATFANIKWGRWCPECSTGLGERICRAYVEQIFGRKFPKSRPTWLINEEGFRMELDGYCRTLGLAFEHQGLQHFQQRSQFQTAKQFAKRQRDDIQKKNLCNQNNVTLIEVPQIPDLLPLTQIQSYIIEQCQQKGFDLPIDAERAKVTLRAAYSPTARMRLQALREVASSHGGACLSPAYLGIGIHLLFRCAEGHQWRTIPNVIFKNHWCPKCGASKRGKARRLTLSEMQEIAMSKGGRCLSQHYVNANSTLLWECNNGHRWKAIPNSIKRGSWCPICVRTYGERKRGSIL